MPPLPPIAGEAGAERARALGLGGAAAPHPPPPPQPRDSSAESLRNVATPTPHRAGEMRTASPASSASAAAAAASSREVAGEVYGDPASSREVAREISPFSPSRAAQAAAP